jgi:uncharacterized protein YcaQ
MAGFARSSAPLDTTDTSLPIRLSQDEARRFLVTRHGLAQPRSLPARPDSVLKVVDRTGMLQFDPLEVPGTRNHDLVLHSRIDGYRRDWTDEWLYGRDRRLFEIYNKSLNIIPIGELPHHRVSWDRYATHYNDGVLREHADAAHNILQRIEAEGPLSTAAFAEHANSIDWWWAPTRVARAVLEALFVVGRVGISRREGNRRYYDLVERLVPEELLQKRESAEEGQLHRILSRYRAVGLTWPSAPAELMVGTGKADDRSRRTSQLVERGDLVPVEVEGLKGMRYAPSTDRKLLEAVQSRRRADRHQPGVAFIAPLDPVMWDRRLLRQLWSFDYVWEVYVPEQKRRWGYYVLPILFGEEFVGRFEPRVDRASGTLRILGIWWQDGFSPRATDSFVPAMRDALRAYMQFVGATRIEWLPQTAGAGRLFGTLKTKEGTRAR